MREPAPLKKLTWRLWLSYHGAAYAGFQFQPGPPSIEAELAKALEKIVSHPVKLRVAGRTDAGVHAHGQVVSTTLNARLDARQLVLALSTQLPADIAVWRADVMPDTFDARLQSIGKQYCYRIMQSLGNDPFEHGCVWHVRQRLDAKAMADAAAVFVGEHDFESFRSASCVSQHARRYIWHVGVEEKGKIIKIDIRGNAFCHNQVRIMVGTLVEVGRGKLCADDVTKMLLAKDRTLAGPTAKAYGLSLARVYYPDELQYASIPQGAVFPRYPVTKESWPFEAAAISYGPS